MENLTRAIEGSTKERDEFIVTGGHEGVVSSYLTFATPLTATRNISEWWTVEEIGRT